MNLQAKFIDDSLISFVFTSWIIATKNCELEHCGHTETTKHMLTISV